MATQDQWYEKIKAWVPSWVFNDEYYQVAVFEAISKVIFELETRADEHQAETFIETADGGYLDEHGLERSLDRAPGELDPVFRERIRYITNSTSKPAIKRLVDALLTVGECTITEDFDGSVFCNRDDYMNRGAVLITAIYNVFSIIVDKQVHAPYSFCDRENFLNREDYIGEEDSLLSLFQQIVIAVDKAKALGTLYRLIERTD